MSLFVYVVLCSFQASGKNLNLNDESQHGLLMQLLKLSYNCLNYDFIGTSTDESSDDLCTVQIPTSWRSGSSPQSNPAVCLVFIRSHEFSCVSLYDIVKPVTFLFSSFLAAFLDSSTLQLFFNLYHSIPPSLSPLVRALHFASSWLNPIRSTV